MKRILGFLLAAASSFAFATTLLPVQLLNPAGSSAGQLLTSTGASSAPGWSALVIGNLSPVAANTVLANATGSTAVVAAFAMPGCSSASSALQWTSGAGFSCYLNSAATTGTLAQFATTTSAQLAGVISDETGSGAAVFGTSPTITAPSIVGVTGGSAAAVGNVGELLTATGTAVSLTNNIPTNCTSKSLTAGDWDVSASVAFAANTGTTTSLTEAGISATSATLPPAPLFTENAAPVSASFGSSFAVPTQPINISSAATYFVVVNSAFAVSTMTVTCVLNARRRH